MVENRKKKTVCVSSGWKRTGREDREKKKKLEKIRNDRWCRCMYMRLCINRYIKDKEKRKI